VSDRKRKLGREVEEDDPVGWCKELDDFLCRLMKRLRHSFSFHVQVLVVKQRLFVDHMTVLRILSAMFPAKEKGTDMLYATLRIRHYSLKTVVPNTIFHGVEFILVKDCLNRSTNYAEVAGNTLSLLLKRSKYQNWVFGRSWNMRIRDI